jgi:uncharacterized membrane protein YvlD (DUF360 family)
MDALREAARFVYRLVVLWIVDVISLLVTAAILPGFALESVEGRSVLIVAVAAAFLLGLVNLLIRPVILLLAMPLGLIAVSLVGFVVNTIALRITAGLLPGFVIDNWWVAFAGGLILALINTIITNFLTIDDEGSFYEALVERLAKRHAFDVEQEPGRGVVMVEIDGLSYHHLEKALEKGLMPTVGQMIREEGYVLSRVDCGLPSQTSACQSGIMFGDNYDIPAFRWYDKDQGKLMVSGSDAPLINARYARGNGLLRGGSSINNMMNGDAAKSLLTLADFRTEDEEQKRRRAEDIYLLMLNPYFFVRTLILFFGDALLELWQGFKQRLRNEQPRLNRLHRAYPLLRASTTVVMRDIATYLTSLDIIRGTPALYVTWPGYDEVAHHSGPWSSDAFGVLKRYDQVIARIRDVMSRKAPRPYELILLSDHGQSFGATFKQRYGYELKEFIEGQLPGGTRVAQSVGGDDGTIAVAAMAGELENVQDQQVSGNLGRAVVGRAQRLLQQGADRRAPAEIDPEATVTVCGSGNLAQVYFDLYPRKITLNELNAAYPGLVDALVGHEGVGFVVAYADDGTPMVFGKQGARDLHSGQITGEDPLAPFGDVALRARQVRRIADFPHAGDLIVNSTLYPDGTVAAMEELIGNHGGLGGEQTDAFLLHPGDMTVPETANSADLFAILDARRDLPVVEGEPGAAEKEGEIVRAWALGTLGQGLRQGRVWLVRALRALVLSRSAYREVVSDPYMTGPALLIAVLAALLAAALTGQTPLEVVIVWAVRLLGWLLGVLAVFGAGRLLGGRGSFTATLRGVGFAQAVYLLELLALIPALSSLVQLITSILVFVATWMAGLEAHELRGLRGLLLPVARLLVVVLSIVVLGNLIAGAGFSVEALLREAGLLAPGP